MSIIKEEIEKKSSTTQANNQPRDFSKLRTELKTLQDAVLELNDYAKINPNYADKQTVLDAIHRNDLEKLREISNFFFKTSGIYNRLCRYMAYLYRYDWIVTPYIGTEKNTSKILDTFNKILFNLDNFNVKKTFGDIALKVMRYGCYYASVIRLKEKVVLQELPVAYCRSRYTDSDGYPVIEFNMRYFDDAFRDAVKRMKILNLFPKDFKRGYLAYKEGRLPAEEMGDTPGWYMLDPQTAIRFNLNGENFPPFITIIPALIDLADAQNLDRKKMAQRLIKIIIQKMPIDKNGDLIFGIQETKELHNNAVAMLSKSIGLDVLTTFADVDVESMDDSSDEATDELERVERSVYNESGVAQNLFNTDGNLALEKSILNDEASLYNLITQFEDFLNLILNIYNRNPKKVYYKAQLLSTTIYNYKDLAKLYGDQTKVGYSKMLPQIALGQSQSSILANAYFENDILDLANVFIPPMTSNTMNAETLASMTGDGSGEGGGRPEKPDDEKSEKTIQNRESMS